MAPVYKQKLSLVLCPLAVRSSLKSDSCISAINWVSVRWYYTGNQRLIIAAGWQSVILHNELVLYTENIRVYSPRIARSSYIEIQGQPKAHAPAQLILSVVVTED